MTEKRIIEAIKRAYPIAEGSKPKDITKAQQRAANGIGELLLSAHRKGRRFKGRWV